MKSSSPDSQEVHDPRSRPELRSITRADVEERGSVGVVRIEEGGLSCTNERDASNKVSSDSRRSARRERSNSLGGDASEGRAIIASELVVGELLFSGTKVAAGDGTGKGSSDGPATGSSRATGTSLGSGLTTRGAWM